jgi:uncharacterized protein involved in high-affinity Fe2+ transport
VNNFFNNMQVPQRPSLRRLAAALLLGACAGARAQAPAPTPGHIPPHAVGNEANEEQLALAVRQGQAYLRAVDWELAGAAWSARARAGDQVVSAAISPAEGGWSPSPNGLAWTDPAPGQAHLRVFLADGADGRFVPGARVQARFFDAAGRLLAEQVLDPGIYPLTPAYGSDLALPAGAATLAIAVEPLPMRRHDPYNGDRFFAQANAVFTLPALGPVSGTPASERAEHAPQALRDGLNGALDATIAAMWKQANAGAAERAGDYDVGYAVEYAEAYWEFRGRQFRYAIENEQSAHFNAHVEVVPRDHLSGQFLPGTRVSATLVGPDGPVPPPSDHGGMGAPRGPGDVPLMWHSWLYHYGQNWRVEHAGTYRLQVHIEPPPQRRYGKASGKRLGVPVDVVFDNVTIKTGQK